MDQKDFQKLYEEYNGKISDMNIKNEFDMLYSISQDSDVFLVTVLGSVNAGKSTFFNCLIHNEISETKNNENTIRPNLVFNSKSETFKTYVKKSEQIDINKVLNYLFDPKKNDISDCLEVKERTFEEAKKNQNEDKIENLFTSFGLDLKVKDIKDKRIVFVDMPGNDGIKAGENYDPFYELILKRTDLVIVVCSSSNEITITMTEYIKSITESNAKVPFVIVINKRDDKGVFKGETDESVSKLLYSIPVLKIQKAKVDEENSAILNAYHIYYKMQGKEPKEDSKEKVKKSYEDFEKFEKGIINTYFIGNQIDDKQKANQKSRFQSQIDNLRQKIENKVSELKDEIEKFNDELNVITPAEGSEDNIKGELNALSTPIALDNSEDMKNCAKFHNDPGFWKSELVKILETEYVPLHLKSALETIFSEYMKKFVEELDRRVKGSQWKDVVSYDNKKYEYELPDKIPFKKCLKNFRLFSYKRDDLEAAMKELKKYMLNYANMGVQIFNACKDIKDRYFGEIGEKERIPEKEELLMTLEAILKKL